MSSPEVARFIGRWDASGAAERSNYALFLTQLCDLLEVSQPDPTTDDSDKNAYVFERDVTFDEGDGTTSIGRIDLYKRSCFVLEAKQGSDAQRAEEEEERQIASESKRRKKGTAVRGTKAWDDAMVKARGQADRYARALPVSEGWPPFLMVVDVGHVIELYSEFSRSGKTYVPFPDPQSYRIKLEDLADEKIRERLRLVWTDPLSLDPSRKSAKVTRELAQRLAQLAKILEQRGDDPALVARFLMRCLFTMFAEDVELIPKGSFKDLLVSLKDDPAAFKPMAEDLWQTMNAGGFSPILRKHLLRFNGGLFAEHEALPLSGLMLKLLIDAAVADWTDVEPAIFGTLLERALNPIERHKLGAHYTPRAYVERLVMPTVIEPLREGWNAAYAAALIHARQGDLDKARELVLKFHGQLCETRVLDPACGSGNFLYVTLEHMKRLEGEVLNALKEFGYAQKILLEVDPHQFLGIEINPRAAAIADLVLWIGYLQWHFRTRGKAQPAEPIIKNYQNIECRDAVLAWDRTEPLLDDDGKPVTRWDGRTEKTHPVTGEKVPDETAGVEVLKYINPRKAEWPKADYVVGNPPYLGVRRLKTTVGREYVETLVASYPEVPETADYVMYWWHKAAELVESENVKRFGLITTNSIVQQYSRPALDLHLSKPNGVQIIFAIADHPWVDDAEGAAVQVAMTVSTGKTGYLGFKRLGRVSVDGIDDEATVSFEQVSKITSLLRSDFDLTHVHKLNANENVCFQGIIPGNDGFKLLLTDLAELHVNAGRLPKVVRRYVIGKDLVQKPVQKWVIDCFGLTADEVRTQYSQFYQRLFDRVKPERDQNPRETRRRNWWLFAENAPKMRRALAGLNRYIATPNTAKHRPFLFLDGDVLPDAMAYAVASNDALLLGVLSSRPHQIWALQTGGTLEDRPRYNSKVTFSPFPFPVCDDAHKQRIRELAEQLDAHRKRQQELHPKLTLTDMYNVLEKLRAGEPLSVKEKRIHDEGLVSVLKQIHDDLDPAVVAAYGWPATLTDEQILERLVALNAERAAEEARGLIRWLRPDFQQAKATGTTQKSLALPEPVAHEPTSDAQPRTPQQKPKQPWPKERSDRTIAVQKALASFGGPVTAAALAKKFHRARASQLEEILDALTALGLARRLRGGEFTP